VTRDRPAACLNCGSDRVRDWCPDCGQRNVDLRLPARELVVDALEDGLSLDSRIARTAGPFLFRPGFLVAEWSAGRRARYSSPLRIYLLMSAVFFLSAGAAGYGAPSFARDGEALREVAAELEGAGEGEAERAGAPGAPAVPGGATGTTGGSGPEGPALDAGSEEAHRNLRAAGALGRLADDRWRVLAGLSRSELQMRITAAFREWIPRVVFFLVPAAVLLLALLWPRRWLSEHVVLSLHLHAFAFTVFTAMLLARLLPWDGPVTAIRVLLVASLPAYLLAALRRVYGQGWGPTLLKAAAGSLLYLAALAIGLVGVAALALTFA
jgi:hypothetical protein